VIKEDALLGSFLAEPSFEQWRKHSSISLEEESASKRIDRVEEMTIPSDLEDKLGYVSLSFFLSSSCMLDSFPTELLSDMFDKRSPLSSKPGRKSAYWENASSESVRLQRYEAPALGRL